MYVQATAQLSVACLVKSIYSQSWEESTENDQPTDSLFSDRFVILRLLGNSFSSL